MLSNLGVVVSPLTLYFVTLLLIFCHDILGLSVTAPASSTVAVAGQKTKITVSKVSPLPPPIQMRNSHFL